MKHGIEAGRKSVRRRKNSNGGLKSTSEGLNSLGDELRSGRKPIVSGCLWRANGSCQPDGITDEKKHEIQQLLDSTTKYADILDPLTDLQGAVEEFVHPEGKYPWLKAGMSPRLGSLIFSGHHQAAHNATTGLQLPVSTLANRCGRIVVLGFARFRLSAKLGRFLRRPSLSCRQTSK